MGMQLSYAAGPGLAPAAPTARARADRPRRAGLGAKHGRGGRAANLAEDLVEDR
jgi:hypothetical protein